jgi:hypothetical protein
MLVSQNDPRLNEPRRRQPAPVQFAGQWVAWNDDRTEILAHGEDSETVWLAAIASGARNPLLEKVRRPGISFIGAR